MYITWNFHHKIIFMRKILGFVFALFIANTINAAFVTTGPSIYAADIFIPVGKSGATISLLELSTIKIKDFETLTGNKLNFTERVKFKIAQKKVRDNIMPDGSFESKKMKKTASMQSKGGATGFHLGGFALGFFLSLIGVLIAYLMKEDFRRNRIKWAWIGALVGLIIGFGLFL